MNDQGRNSSIQSLAAGLLGFVGIVGLGSLVMVHHGGAAAKPPLSIGSPADADAGGLAPLRAARPAAAVAGGPSAVQSSPAPLLSAEATDADDAAAPAAASAAASAAAVPGGAPAGAPPAAAAPRLTPGAPADMSGSAASTASAAAAAPATATLKQASARKPFIAPKLNLPRNAGTVASMVHYGVSDRTELMGRAVGPVYNFSGGSGANGGRVAAGGMTASGALRQVDAAERQIDGSNAPAEDKAKLRAQLNEVRASAGTAAR